MNPDFVRQHAPELAIPSGQNEWVTPEPSAGLAPENLYNQDGTPLNWMQNQGEERTFLAPRNGPVLAPVAGNPGLQEEVPLRGRTPQGPSGPVAAPPQDLMRQPSPGYYPSTRIMPRQEIRVPGQHEAVASAGLRDRQQAQAVGREAVADRTLARAVYPPRQTTMAGVGDVVGQNTDIMTTNLRGLLERMNFQVPNWMNPDRDANRRVPTLPETSLHVDPASSVRGARVTRAGYTPGAGAPDFSTEEGLAEFNRRMGLNLNRQSRTQAEQDDLYNRGLTPTRNSAHIGGRAFDWPGSQLDGRTGTVAERYARDQVAARYGPEIADSYTYEWETGRGRNQGTGPHVHAQPRRR